MRLKNADTACGDIDLLAGILIQGIKPHCIRTGIFILMVNTVSLYAKSREIAEIPLEQFSADTFIQEYNLEWKTAVGHAGIVKPG